MRTAAHVERLANERISQVDVLEAQFERYRASSKVSPQSTEGI